MSQVSSFRKILVPVISGCDYAAALTLAGASAHGKNVLMVGMVSATGADALGGAALDARRLRADMRAQARKVGARRKAEVIVTDRPWQELKSLIQEVNPDLLILEWPCQLDALSVTAAQAMQEIPCDLALVRGPIISRPAEVLVSMRGGPNAELALRLGLSIEGVCGAQVTSLHILPSDPDRMEEDAYQGLSAVLDHMPEVSQIEIKTDDPAAVILETSHDQDLVILGAGAQSTPDQSPLSAVTRQVLHESSGAVAIVKTARPIHTDMAFETIGRNAISILVDKWFARNTFRANQFANLHDLLEMKERQGLTISLALPALNEEKTVGKVIETIQLALMERVPLLDEIVLMDSDSRDQTRQIAASLGVPVYIHQQVLPAYGARRGKGEALWKSLYVTRGDIILWLDTDIVNIHPRFVYGLLGPLLSNPALQFVKGFYRRPLRVGDKIQAGGGGRVTELTARPLINLFFPHLSGVIQPLAGEYGGRRAALEQLPFFSGYGVEIGLLIDVADKYGIQSIAQVDLKERVHHNQPLQALSKMSFAIIQAVSHKLEGRFERNILEEVNKTMKLVNYDKGRFFLDVEEIAERERPPMVELLEYQAKLTDPSWSNR